MEPGGGDGTGPGGPDIGSLKVLVPVATPRPVPPAPPGGWGRRATWFSDGCEPFRQVARSWAVGLAGTVVTLGSDATPAARAALLRGVRHAHGAGGPLVLVHGGAGGASLLHTLSLERPGMACAAVEVAPTRGALEAAWAVARAPLPGSIEVTVDARGLATVPAWREAAWPNGRPSLAPGDRVLVTGGTGGLGSAVALHLGRRLKVHPVLVDTAPLGAARTQATLSRLSSAGVACTHLVADVTDAASVAGALRGVGAERPITAVVHCAGLISGGRLATLDVAGVDRLRAPKVDGLRTLLATLDRRDLRVVLGFGSVLSHVPHPSVGAYAYANELLRRELRRAQCYAPGPRYLAVEWSVWDGAGMAFASGATAQARRAGYAPIALAEGLSAVERLLGWPGPEAGVLVGSCFPGLRPRAGRGVRSTSRAVQEGDRRGRTAPGPARTPTPRTR
jgi:NAD(P)-dependent dehydrogenase (short-subunit alcohol dehydrogenase family)